MKHLMGLLKPDAGHIYVDGQDVVPMNDVELNRIRLKFGMSFQYSALFDSYNVEDNVAFPLVEHSKKSRRDPRPGDHAAHELGLNGIEKKFPAELSGGMQTRRIGPRAGLRAGDPSVR